MSKASSPIRHETEQGDVVLLADLTYRDFFANYGKFSEDDARIVSLPYHPGEQPSPEQAPEIVFDNPDLLLHQTAALLLHLYNLIAGRPNSS